MTATKTVPQPSSARNRTRKVSSQDPESVTFYRLFAPSHGVVVLVGYGIKVRVDRGHLILEDGIGTDRRTGRFPRVHHGLRRVIVIGADGMVSLAAFQWLADQNIAFVMLERDGSVLISTGPVAASDTRLRRAQACAQHSEAAVNIVRELISVKLAGQEALVRDKLRNSAAADLIGGFGSRLGAANTIDDLRILESHGAGVYWAAWQNVEVLFPKSDVPRVPDHWRTFGNRRSPISGTSRRAANPLNAILNYLYTLLESETRLAITALGLDPGFGLLHVDQATRDSLVYDLMEPVRPKIDAYLFDWIARTAPKRSWFFEQRDGTCRLMAPFALQLTDTTSTWGRDVAPFVEWFAHVLCSTGSKNNRLRAPGTRLTQRNRCEGAGSSVPLAKGAPKQQSVCSICGKVVSLVSRHCPTCKAAESGKRLSAASRLGSIAGNSPEALAKRSHHMTLHRDAIRGWQPTDLPDWLTDEVYMTKILPLLARVSRRTIELALSVCKRYAYEIASGVKIPHPRHWLKLAELVGVNTGTEGRS